MQISIAPVINAQNDKAITLSNETAENPSFENNFENIHSAQYMAHQLRKTFGIQGSVVLSKAVWQILSSYSNQDQAENIWQTAIETVSTIDENSLEPIIDLQFSTGQVLSTYTHGMTLDKWYKNRVGVVLDKNSVDEFFNLNDDLTIYRHLQAVWQLINDNIVKHEDINWKNVFQDSIHIIADNQGKTVSKKSKKSSFYSAYSQWIISDDLYSSLADLMKFIDESDSQNNAFYSSMIRFNLNKHLHHLLAASIDWLEVSYHLSQFKVNLPEEDTTNIEAFIEQNDVWFLTKEQQLLSINLRLPEMLESNIHQLKAFYNNQISELSTDQQLTTAYEIIEPRITKYMATPFRQKIKEELEVCLHLSETFAPYPQNPIDEKQFKGCIKDITAAAVTESITRELSGSLTKVDTNKQALDRALRLPAWQIINILYARLAQSQCIDQSHQLANPLEWTLAAESVLWFADRWPSYVRAFLDDNMIQDVIQQGEKLNQGFICLEKPLTEIFNSDFLQIVQAWQGIKAQINQVTEEFNQINLSEGSDLDLLGSAEQNSNYRVVDAQITACDAQKSCGVHASLESSRALFGLFSNHLLVADQLKLGQLKLCYDNVGWENRRSAATHLDNTSVANYFGNFSFSIKGFYDSELVFEKKIVSSQEFHYLFAENNEETLSAYCPLSMVGNKISTQLERGTFGLVPNRLTFLTASRASESNILTSNWSTGHEWRDKLLETDNKAVSENNLIDIKPVIHQAYQHKATQLQELIYATLMDRLHNPTQKQQLLTESFKNLQRMTQLLQASLSIVKADKMLTSDQLHGLFYGLEKIPNHKTIVGYYKNQLNINQLIEEIDENLKNNEIKWNNLSPQWSNTYLNNILYRLKNIQF